MEYAIGTFSKLSGLGIHTLRYYEKEGLLAPQRNAAGRRRYSEADLAWVSFLKRLKETGMPIREIRRYAGLRALGDITLAERMELLICHRENLERQIQSLLAHRENLDEKITLYQAQISHVQKNSEKTGKSL